MDDKIKEIYNIISEIGNEDETMLILEKAMNSFCSNYDKCEGFKMALLFTLDDQVNNHKEDLEEKDLDKLLSILKQ